MALHILQSTIPPPTVKKCSRLTPSLLHIVENLEPDALTPLKRVASSSFYTTPAAFWIPTCVKMPEQSPTSTRAPAARAIHYLSSITDRQPAQLKSGGSMRSSSRTRRPLLAHLVGDSVALEISCADHVWPIKASLEDLELIISSLSANARDEMPDGGKLRWSVTNVAVSVPPSPFKSDTTTLAPSSANLSAADGQSPPPRRSQKLPSQTQGPLALSPPQYSKLI